MSSLNIDQALRPLEIITPLGENVLGLRSIHVHEQLGGGFNIDAELSSEDPDIKFDHIVGHPVGVRLSLPGGRERYWHALVARFSMTEQNGHFFHYRATLVPWLWALTRSADCRMFQHHSVTDIVQQVFRDRGAKDFEPNLSGTYPVREYCVQYRETDFDFVSRLMEEEGIAYYFKHDRDRGVMVLADEKASYETVKGYAELLYRPNDEEGRQDSITSWQIEHEVQSTQYALSDYNPLKPKESLVRMAKVDRAYGMNDRQIFDYPGEVISPDEAERLTRIRLDELQVAAEIVRAQTTALGLGVGNLFTLKEHPRAEQNQEYLVTSLALGFDAGEFSSKGSGNAHSTCSFTAVPSSQTYRPPRTTPKPVVHGPQPAVVVGPSGEEIYTDEHGRVKVSFYWDRQSKADEKSSCWIRVAQGWAGKKWGGFYLPRVGHEVLVEFLEGDPDRPIITGSVYNGENGPPYPLPAEKTKSTLKSLSSKGGGGFNEIRFEDKKGEEQVFTHAEKDQEIRVKHDTKEWVGNDRHLEVERDQIEHVKRDRNDKVDRDHVEEIGKDLSLKIKGDSTEEISGKLSLKVTKDVAEIFSAGHYEETTGQHYLTAKEVVIEAGKNITIQVGDSYIAIDKTGVTIGTKGKFNVISTGNSEIEAQAMIKLTSTGSMNLKASAPMSVASDATLEVKSPKTTVKGDGMVEISGGMVKIN